MIWYFLIGSSKVMYTDGISYKKFATKSHKTIVSEILCLCDLVAKTKKPPKKSEGFHYFKELAFMLKQ
jgi:hypothetical protein